MTPRPHKLHHTRGQPHFAAQSGIVLLTVLVMLVVASAWATYAWRQVFWQQRMLHSQGLEQMAWQAAEAGALHVQHHIAQKLASNPSMSEAADFTTGLTTYALPGSPSSQWVMLPSHGVFSSKLDATIMRISIAGQVIDPLQSPQTIAQAHVIVDIEQSSLGLQITRWQRVYPR